MGKCSKCDLMCDDQGCCPEHWYFSKTQVHIRANFNKMHPETKDALGRMIKLAIAAIRRGDFDNPPTLSD